jgi:hypothetical protein
MRGSLGQPWAAVDGGPAAGRRASSNARSPVPIQTADAPGTQVVYEPADGAIRETRHRRGGLFQQREAVGSARMKTRMRSARGESRQGAASTRTSPVACRSPRADRLDLVLSAASPNAISNAKPPSEAPKSTVRPTAGLQMALSSAAELAIEYLSPLPTHPHRALEALWLRTGRPEQCVDCAARCHERLTCPRRKMTRRVD